MAFPESKSIAWKVFEELLGITFSAAATGTPSSTTALFGDGSWKDSQPLDADLSAIAALSGTSGIARKTAANTWELETAGPLCAYAPGSFTIPTESGRVMVDSMKLTGSQTATLVGTSTLRIV